MQLNPQDETIRTNIESKLNDNPRIQSEDISVEFSGGKLTLSGSVADKDEKLLAENIARSVSGVREVNNRLEFAKEKTPNAGQQQAKATSQNVPQTVDEPAEAPTTGAGYDQGKSRQQNRPGS